MDKRDLICLRHMLDAAQEAISFSSGKTRGDLDTNRMLVLALIKDLEIIGEAANKISEQVRIEYNDLPWRNIVDMRNRLIHGYFDIDLDIVWTTITEELPVMINLLSEILSV